MIPKFNQTIQQVKILAAKIIMSSRYFFFTNVVKIAAEKRMSHQDLAYKANISTGAMSSITRGQGNPTLETMEAIATALETPLPFLLTNHDLEEEDIQLLDTKNIDEQDTQYECVTVILPRYKAFLVKKWGYETLKKLKLQDYDE